MFDCLIIGGGAAGLFAAANLSENNKIAIIDHSDRLGKKLSITGKGRCNITNSSVKEEFFSNIRCNSNFFYSAFSQFSNFNLIDYFENIGVKLKTERGNRVFPESDNAQEVVSTLINIIKSKNHQIIFDSVIKIEKIDDCILVCCKKKKYFSKKVILATGGMSYPSTGSDGSGYSLAKMVGHTIVTPKASLVPIELKEKSICQSLTGLSLKNISIQIIRNDKSIYSDFGEMMFTPYGVTGPLILSASSFFNFNDILRIDLKPAIDLDKLDKRLISDFEIYKNKDFCNALSDLLPSKLILPFISLTGIDPHIKVNSITKIQRRKIVYLLKNLDFCFEGCRPITEAIITSGGVSVNEINPKTMESKIVKNLYFAGEIIDIDAFTGGFNLQIAFSTAYVAAKSIND